MIQPIIASALRPNWSVPFILLTFREVKPRASQNLGVRDNSCCGDAVLRVTDCSPKGSLLDFSFSFSVFHSWHWDSALASSVPRRHVACRTCGPRCSGHLNCWLSSGTSLRWDSATAFESREYGLSMELTLPAKEDYLFQTLISPPLPSPSGPMGEFDNLLSLHLDQGSLCGLLCAPSLIPVTTANESTILRAELVISLPPTPASSPDLIAIHILVTETNVYLLCETNTLSLTLLLWISHLAKAHTN